MFMNNYAEMLVLDALRKYLLQIEFAGAAAATLTFYNGEVDSLVITDASGVWSVASGKMSPGAAASGAGQPYFHSLLSRLWAGGRTYAAQVNAPSSIGAGNLVNQVFWAENTLNTGNTAAYGVRADRGVNAWRNFSPSGTFILGEAFAVDTDYAIAIVQRPTAGFFAFLNDALVWVDTSVSATTVNVAASTGGIANAPPFTIYYARVGLLTGNIATDFGICSQNVASPSSGTDYTCTADSIDELTITAPDPLAGTTGFRFHHTSDNDCNFLYTDSTSGRIRLDTVVAGVATNRISVNSIWAVGTTVTARVIHTGSLMDVYTLSGSTWTKRGSQVNLSNQNSVASVAPTIGGSYTIANLRSYPRTSSDYSGVDLTP